MEWSSSEVQGVLGQGFGKVEIGDVVSRRSGIVVSGAKEMEPGRLGEEGVEHGQPGSRKLAEERK